MAQNTAYTTDRPNQYDQNNYVKAQRWLQEQGRFVVKRGEAVIATVKHDDWCGIYGRHLCNCRPDIILNGKRLKYPARILGDTYAPNRQEPPTK